MRGIPRVIKTRADVHGLMDMWRGGSLRPQHAELLHDQLRALRDGRMVYVRDRVLQDGEEPDGPEPHYRVMEEETGADGATEQVQFRLEDSPSAKIYRLGFSLEEVEQLITELEAQ